ncbi:hypothetical protein F442_19696, partial [Phytophthora nicotianae P10297]
RPPHRRKFVQTTLDTFLPSSPCFDAAVRVPSFAVIAENIGSLAVSEWPPEKCNCTRACASSCINRQRRVQCSPATCNIGSYCDNRPWSGPRFNIQIEKAGSKGFGVFSLEVIPKEALVCEYVGEIIDEAEKKKRQNSLYLMEYASSGTYIDAGRAGNIARFINHSCAPNCQAEEWTVSGLYRIGIVALRDISAFEEITIHYGPSFHFGTCLCEQCNR